MKKLFFGLITSFILSSIFIGCNKKEVNKINKEEKISQLIMSKEFDNLITSAKNLVNITSKNEEIVNSFQSLLEKSAKERSAIEKQIFDVYTIQVEAIKEVKTIWPEITKLSNFEFKHLIDQYSSYKISLTGDNKIKTLDDASGYYLVICNVKRNEGTNSCFAVFLFDTITCGGSLWGGPKCYLDAVVAQYRCNQSVERDYRNCVIK